MLLGAAAIWGLSTCIIKDTVAVFPPAWLMGIRFFLAGILLLIVSVNASHNALAERCSLPAQ